MKNLFLFQPVKPWYINQAFGDNKACINLTTNVVTSKVPFTNETVCPPGTKSVYSQMKGHNGLDVMAKRWQPVYSAQDGIVNEIETEASRGLGVGVVTNDKYFCNETGKPENFKIRYWHLIAIDVDFGEKVEVGTLIGYADSTGYSSGDHLHFEIKPVLVKDYENGVPVVSNLLQDNGYFGAVDPIPYMEMEFALDFAGVVKSFRELLARFNDFLADKLRNK